MNAAAAERLEDLLRGRNPATVVQATIRRCPMTPGTIRERFARGTDVEMLPDGMGVREANGDWLFIENDQPVGGR